MKDFNNDNDKLNKKIREKFSDARVQPGNHVWEGIEAELLKQDHLKLKRKAVFYRNVAAAILLLAMVSLYFNVQEFSVKSNADITEIQPIDFSDNDKLVLDPNNTRVSRLDQPKIVKEQQIQTTNNEGSNKLNNSDQVAQVIFRPSVPSEKRKEPLMVVFNPSTGFLEEEMQLERIPNLESLSPELIAFEAVERQIKEVSYFAISVLDAQKKENTMAWNSNVNIGSGAFNPNAEITSSPVLSTVSTLNTPGTAMRTNESTDQNSTQERDAVQDLSSAPMRSNVSFTLGINAGVQVNDRWTVKSGLQYGTYRSSANSSTVIRDKNSDLLFPYHGASSSSEISDGKVINVTSEYDFYNDFQILSIPLMLSYKLIDRKFDVSVVGGASADFILRNTLRGGSDQISEISFNQKDRQSYRNAFASTFVGVELSYPFADKYALNIMPTYKRAVTNATTENATFNSMPAFLGLNMSLQYIF